MLPIDIFLVGIIIGALLFCKGYKIWHSYSVSRRVLNAGKAEAAARKFLEAEGYTILAVQERVPIITKVNGKANKSHIQADLIVQKGKETFVVDVKTGEVAQRPASPENRRQLLEYFLVYRTDGVIILDMDSRKLYKMEFEIKYPSPGTKPLPYFICFCAGIIVALILFKGGYLS